MHSTDEIVELSIKSGIKKANMPILSKMLLGIIGGALVAMGYLAYVKVTAAIPHEWAPLVGGAVFPIGLIGILLGGGELITGNMMTLSIAWYDKKVTLKQLLSNWLIITLGNFIGALLMAFLFGHLLGLTETGVYLDYTREIAMGKIDTTFLKAFISGIGCNWMVGLAVWLCYGAKDAAGKIMAAWFPTMIFVAIGFQHSVANLFIIPAAIFGGADISWLDLLTNFIPVYLGNVVGGSVVLSGIYYLTQKKTK